MRLGDNRAEAFPPPSVFSVFKYSSFGSADVGIKGYLTRHQLAFVYYQQGRWEEAETEWKLALADRPGYFDALKGLGEMYLKQSRWAELEQVVERLGEKKTSNHESHELHEYEGRMLQTRGMLARKEFEAARPVSVSMVTVQPAPVAP